MDGEQPAPKEGGNSPDIYAQYLIPVIAFTGGLVFAALVLVLQAPYSRFEVPFLMLSPKQYFRVLITLMAISSVLSVLSSFGLTILAHGNPDLVNRKLYEFTYSIGGASVGLVLIILPMILYPFTEKGVYVLALVEVVLVVLLRYFTHGEEISGSKAQMSSPSPEQK